MKQGLYANVHAKQARIAEGSGERMRKVGSKGAPTAKAFIDSAKTAKKPKKVK
jgi:hypothetical protein